jgi:hypothetical protein
MKTRVFVSMDVESERMTSEQIAEMIGLEADRSWRIGDKRGRSQILETTNGWSVSSGLDEGANLDDHIAALLKRVQPVAGGIARLSGQVSVEISCAVYAVRPPALAFPPRVVQQLADLKTGLDIDLYIIGKPKREEMGSRRRQACLNMR